MIFYFSATGNSLYVAKKLADKLKAECISMAEALMDRESCVFHAEKNEEIGFVVPVYFSGLPRIVTEFLAKLNLENLDKNYIFLVQTYGAMSGNAAALFQDELLKRGIKLSAAFSICSVDTYIPMFDIPKEKEATEILQKADIQLSQVCDCVASHETNNQMKKRGGMTALITKFMQRNRKNGSKTASFAVESSCIGCGLCEKVCPSGAIKIQDGKPVWEKDSCALCFGCVHRCPQKAIEYGKKTRGKSRYKNPYVSFPKKYL